LELIIFAFLLIFMWNLKLYGMNLSIFIVVLLCLLLVGKILFKELAYLLFYCIPPLNQQWQSLPFFFRKLIANLVIALSFTIFIIMGFHHGRALGQLEYISMDFVMYLYKKNIPPVKEKSPPFVLLDIDNQTHQSWGKPSYTPRDKLRNLIDAAVRAKARLIVVLIDLSQPTPHDQALYAYLVEYANQCKTRKDIVCPPIILARAFYDNQIVRTSFLEEAVAQAAPYVQWTSTQAYMSYDEVIRRTSLWSPICIDEQPSVIASAELLATSIIRNGTLQQAQEILYNALAPFQPANCYFVSMPLQFTENIKIGEGLSLSRIVPTNRQRIMYRIPWYDTDTPPSLPYIVRDNSEVPILTLIITTTTDTNTSQIQRDRGRIFLSCNKE
jgi:hypothetical protein